MDEDQEPGMLYNLLWVLDYVYKHIPILLEAAILTAAHLTIGISLKALSKT
jgi:hypothetical protein